MKKYVLIDGMGASVYASTMAEVNRILRQSGYEVKGYISRKKFKDWGDDNEVQLKERKKK